MIHQYSQGKMLHIGEIYKLPLSFFLIKGFLELQRKPAEFLNSPAAELHLVKNGLAGKSQILLVNTLVLVLCSISDILNVFLLFGRY